MHVRIVVTDDQGRTFTGDVDLVPSSLRPTKQSKKPSKKGRVANPVTPVLSLNPRAFMKKYAREGAGEQKFTLLLARLANGDPSKEVQLATIKAQWDRMTGVIGKYNPAYSLRAREEDWVDTKKQGVYVLKSSWRTAVPQGE